LTNLDFLPPIPPAELAEEIARADICLGGHFGTTQKAGRVVPGKIYQILASARPLIAGDTQANRRFLSGPDAAQFCRPGDAVSLAEAIVELSENPRLREILAAGGREIFEEKASEASITLELRRILAEIGS
jgi:glycosyltransferase involved in cell wall biosynthesis